VTTMKSSLRRCGDVVDVVITLLLLLLDGGLASPSSLTYCHRLDAHPPRLYATKTAYDEVRAHDLETRKFVVDTDDDSSTSTTTSGVADASQFGIADDYFGQCISQCRRIMCCIDSMDSSFVTFASVRLRHHVHYDRHHRRLN